MGRTELQDAVPMTVGQEFHAFAASLESEIQLLKDAEKYLYAENMGATAIGTGINVPKGYAEKCAAAAREADRQADRAGRRHDRGDLGPAGLRRLLRRRSRAWRSSSSKISSDLILLASGPRAGLAEINLPAMQPGSSIMPGKVNPVMPEVVNVVAFRVMGNDAAVDARRAQRAAPAQRLRAARTAWRSSSRSTCSTTSRCSSAPSASTASRSTRRCSSTTWRPRSASSPRSIPCSATRRPPSWPNEAYKSGKGILEVIREKKVLTEEQIKELLDPIKLTNLDPSQYKKQ